MNTAYSDAADDPAPPEACRFGWFDGRSSHLCTVVGTHDRHYCQRCNRYHDPLLRVVAGPDGRPRATH